MKILLSAYACDPRAGSESGIGWNFAKELALRGDTVHVVTKNPAKDVAFQAEIKRLGIQDRLFVHYYDLPWLFQLLYKSATALEHVFYFFWQVGLYFFAKKLCRQHSFDVIHHITLGVFRTPSFLYMLNVPFIFGPLGGGEECPELLRKNLPLKFKVKELARSFLNNTSRFNPLLQHCYKYSSLILLKTSDNLRYIPKQYHSKCKIELEVGMKKLPQSEPEQQPTGNIRIIYAGRLVYWKGVHLAIKAYARVVQQIPDASFTIVGSGSDELWLKEIARQENMHDRITWIPNVEQSVLFNLYKNHDLLLFPSLHDSSGGVVLEALSFGLPVVCLDIGGPKEIVDKSCSCIITTGNSTEQQVVENIAKTLCHLIRDSDRISTMRKNAEAKAKTYWWKNVVERVYRSIEEHILLYQSV